MKDTKILTDAGIDLNQSLSLFGDMKTYDEMLEDFLREVDGKMDQAKKYKEEANMAEYAVMVHSLKSDCKYFGMMSLADLFYKHELAGKENNYYFVTTDFDNLERELNKMLRVLKKYMGVEVGPEPVDEPASSNNQTIIVVDDSNVVRNFVSKVFSNKYNIHLASDGDEAINIVSNTPHDKLACMLLDLNMPNVNGFTVLDYFKSNNLFDKIPVSIITGINDKETIEKAFFYPIVDMLQKPFNESSVKNVVEKTIARKK